jgi:hypothetical protein
VACSTSITIPRRQAATLLGYAGKYTFKGFGEYNSSVKQIPPEQIENIRAALLKSLPPAFKVLSMPF